MHLDTSGQMENSRPWIALYSQTGSEIVRICSKESIKPTLIISSKENNLTLIKDQLPEVTVISIKNNQDLIPIFDRYKDPLITLHGWLKILPENICNQYEIYNGHPGLITKYPDLKGKDPQIRAWSLIENGKMDEAGCVLHRVIPQVDEGEIISVKKIVIEKLDYSSFVTNLRDASIDLWVEFLKTKLYGKENSISRSK